MTARQPTAATAAANLTEETANQLDWGDEQDWEDARRGFIATLDEPVVHDESGKVVWDLRDYGFLEDSDPPPSVHPNLWRQARLNMIHGLFQIHERIYQIRGFDLSVISFVRGDTGWIVIDPLISAEPARAALDLLFEHAGAAPVAAVIYTHSHVDHFGGVLGVTTTEDVAAGRTRVLAPEGFVEAAISENVYAQNVMSRRASYMYGNLLPRSPRGQVDAGLGKTTSTGLVTFVQPTEVISATGTTLNVDGVEIEFQLTPGTEAPAEMNFFFPEFDALCMAENCSRNMHNLYTLRGAQVRDSRAWAAYMDESILRYGARTELLFTSHHWPTWGSSRAVDYMAKQRDMYKYIHDEALRLANHGHTMVEVAEQLQLPESLAGAWHCRGFYGSVNHNSKAVYQRYLGFFDGNPANLHPLPPAESSPLYVEYMGGAEAVLERAGRSFEAGDYRWVAEVVNHVVFADPDNVEAASLQAAALEQLGYQAESAPWRNFYLTGAQELREGIQKSATPSTANVSFLMAMDVGLILDALAIRLNGPAAADLTVRVNLIFSDLGESYAWWVENGVMNYRLDEPFEGPDLTLTLTKADFVGVLVGDEAGAAGLSSDGDLGALTGIVAHLDEFEFWFPIVTP
jgi:alkyl sulfatase BDS1-like metallo-beta-lactamase superfamily hydrolase